MSHLISIWCPCNIWDFEYWHDDSRIASFFFNTTLRNKGNFWLDPSAFGPMQEWQTSTYLLLTLCTATCFQSGPVPCLTSSLRLVPCFDEKRYFGLSNMKQNLANVSNRQCLDVFGLYHCYWQLQFDELLQKRQLFVNFDLINTEKVLCGVFIQINTRQKNLFSTKPNITLKLNVQKYF